MKYWVIFCLLLLPVFSADSLFDPELKEIIITSNNNIKTFGLKLDQLENKFSDSQAKYETLALNYDQELTKRSYTIAACIFGMMIGISISSLITYFKMNSFMKNILNANKELYSHPAALEKNNPAKHKAFVSNHSKADSKGVTQ